MQDRRGKAIPRRCRHSDARSASKHPPGRLDSYIQPGRYTHNRHTRKDTCVRREMAIACSHYKFITVSLPKRFRNDCFASETVTQRLNNYNLGNVTTVPNMPYSDRPFSETKPPPRSGSTLKNPLGLIGSYRHNSFSRRRRWAWRRCSGDPARNGDPAGK